MRRDEGIARKRVFAVNDQLVLRPLTRTLRSATSPHGEVNSISHMGDEPARASSL